MTAAEIVGGRSPWRLLPLAAAAPERNMSVDAALLEAATEPTLRLYRWEPHAVSLGQFQRHADLAAFRAEGLPVVRRMTGGGAIVHGEEITYSVLLFDDDPLIRGLDVKRSYASVHAPIRAALAALGVPTIMRSDPIESHAARGLLCFSRATELDLVAGGRKIAGSAQRRTAGRVLQHGSILLQSHPLQPGTSAVSEIAGRAVSPDEAARALVAAFDAARGPLVPGALTSDEEAAAARQPSFLVG